VQEILTQRLILKPLQKSDDENLFFLCSDSEVMKYIRKPDTDIFQAKKKIKSLLDYTSQNPSFGLWMAYAKDTKEHLGFVLLLHIENNPEYPIEVGYRLHTKFWNQGYATEMSKALIKYGKDLGLKSVSGITIEENINSIHVLEKSGLKYIEDRLYYELPVRYYEVEL
jgi:ribosomal-protein-alanine N-acetyltransferase